MRLPALLMLSGLTLGAAACATVEPTAPAGPPLAAPAPIAGYDWIYHADGDEAGLAFGVDESDDVWLALSCNRGSGRIELIQPVGEAHPRVISVESGGDTETYPATAEPSELHEGVFLTAEGRASDPVFLRFRRVEWLAVYGPDYRHVMAPHPQSTAGIERFFAFCG
jgi:hypothetical protein